MTRSKHDYKTLRLEYIQSDISIRELAKKHDIPSFSSVNAMKNKEGWDADREAYRTSVAGREIETLVDARMRMVTEIHGELLLAVRHAVRRFIMDVSRNESPQQVSARDLMGMIDKFLLLSGSTPHRTESRISADHSFDFGGLLADAPADVLRELAELARLNGAGAQPVGRGPLVILEGSRSA